MAHGAAFAKGVLGAPPPCLGGEALLKMGLLGTAGLRGRGGGEDGGGAAAAERDGGGWTNRAAPVAAREITGALARGWPREWRGRRGGDELDGRVGSARTTACRLSMAAAAAAAAVRARAAVRAARVGRQGQGWRWQGRRWEWQAVLPPSGWRRFQAESRSGRWEEKTVRN